MVKIRARQAMGELAWALRAGRMPRTPRLIVLMYHAVTIDARNDPAQLTTPSRLFKAHLTWIRDLGLPVLSLRDGLSRLGDGTLGRPVVALTFDDGYFDTYSVAFPILQEFGYSATVFIVPSIIGQARADFAPPHLGPFMAWDHAREMQRHGIDFESHSLTHRKLATIPFDEAAREIADSKRAIEDALSREVTGFCYPFGSYDSFTPDLEAVALDHGYRYLATSLAGHNVRPDDARRLKRLRLSWVDGTRHEIEKECAGCYGWYRVYQRLTG